MKKLICAADVEAAKAKGLTTMPVDNDTIITPSAKDMASAYGIDFSCEAHECAQTATDAYADQLSADAIYSALQALMAKGMLDETALGGFLPYRAETDPSGIKVVRGDSVRMDDFDTGNPADNVTFQEVVCQKISKMSAGFLIIDHSRFTWQLSYEEIDYVISGTLEVTIDGRTIRAKAGDVLFVPKGSNVVWSSPDRAHVFYTTYPANWADLC